MAYGRSVCNLSIHCMMVYCQIPPPTLVGHSILCILILKMGKLIFVWALAPLIAYLFRKDGSLPTCLTVMILMRQSTLNSCCFQTHDPRTAKEAEVVEDPGLFYIYYGAGPLEAGEVIVCGLNWQPWGCPFRENLPIQSNLNGCGVNRFMHMDALGPSPLSDICVMAQAISH